MSKILITGMTAQQCSPLANIRGTTFASLLQKALVSAGHDVAIQSIDPADENLSVYDKVLVGLSPMTSMSANYVYGALHAMQVVDPDKLSLFIDAPEPARITSSLKAIGADPLILSKALYSNRRGYKSVDLKEAVKVCNGLFTARWPTTLYPSLPWGYTPSTLSSLPSGSHSALSSISLDSFIEVPHVGVSKVDKWAADSPSSPWTTKVSAQLSMPVVAMKWHKGWTDANVSEQIAASIGSLIAPHRGGTWWSPRYMQSLLLGTPIATDWHQSQSIGDSWAVLPAGIEAMSSGERYNLTMHQLSAYLTHSAIKSDTIKKLEMTLGISQEKKK